MSKEGGRTPADATLDEVAREWLVTRGIIATAIRQLLRPDLSQGRAEAFASAIIARLASHDPPILTSFSEDA